jgi:hypothetical protein
MSRKFYFVFYLICITTILFTGCGSNVTESGPTDTSNSKIQNNLTVDGTKQSYFDADEMVIDTKENKADIIYGIIIDDIKYMKFIVKNNTEKNFEYVWPTTHTFDFRLYKDSEVIWDSYEDDKSLGEENWETHMSLLAGRQFEQQIWFGNMPKELNGTYNYEFYFIGDQFKSVPHLTGTLDLVSGQDGVCRSKKLKLHMN